MRVSPVSSTITRFFNINLEDKDKSQKNGNYKASNLNFMSMAYPVSFTASKSPTTSKKHLQPDRKPIFDENNQVLIEHPVYKKTAMEIATTLLNGRMAVLEYSDKYDLPEMALDNFKIILKNGQLSKFGYTPEATCFVNISASDIQLGGGNVLNHIISETDRLKNENKKPIVLIEDFYDFWNTISDKDKKIVQSSKKFKEIPIIALYNEFTDTDCVVDYDFVESLGPIETEDLTPGQAINFLKRKDVQNRFIFENPNSDITIDDDAVNLAVRYNREGYKLMPGSALYLLKYAYTLRALRNDPRSIRHITTNDVELAHEKFEEFVERANAYADFDDEDEKPSTSQSKNNGKVPKVKFSDVGGHAAVKAQIQSEFLNLISNPSVKKKDIPKGILLEGPPGTGKTLLAAAIAGEAGLPFISKSGTDFAAKYVGESEENVRQLFREAEKLAKASPKKTCIIFIDEVDALASKRKEDDTSGSDKTVNTLLTELDGIADKDGAKDYTIILIAATNRKDLLDEAFLRPGRIDLTYKVDDPSRNKKARREIIDIHAKGRPFKNEKEKEELLVWLTDSVKGFSGAEIADLFKKAYRMTLVADRTDKYITKADLTEAMLQVEAGIKTESESPKWDDEGTVVHEAGHALTLMAMQKVFGEDEPWNLPINELNFMSNDGRNDFAGLTVYNSSDKNTRYTFASLIADLVSSYGGLSVEKLLFGGNSDGVSGDLSSITKVALKGVTKYGLGPNTGAVAIPDDNELMMELYKKEIKKDVNMMTNLSREISDKIIHFDEGFIRSYLEMYRNNPAIKSEIITAEKFIKMHNDWIAETGKEEEYKNLCAEIKQMIQKAQSSESDKSV